VNHGKRRLVDPEDASPFGVDDKQAKSSEALLTPAEQRVLSLVSASMTNREIASSLKVSRATVKATHGKHYAQATIA
jgi:DNA-binding NarL/FixJ family response regulator